MKYGVLWQFGTKNSIAFKHCTTLALSESLRARALSEHDRCYGTYSSRVADRLKPLRMYNSKFYGRHFMLWLPIPTFYFMNRSYTVLVAIMHAIGFGFWQMQR